MDISTPFYVYIRMYTWRKIMLTLPFLIFLSQWYCFGLGQEKVCGGGGIEEWRCSCCSQRHCTLRHVAYLTLSLSHTHTHSLTHSLSPLSLTHTRLTHQALSLVINVTPLSHLLSFLRENLGVKVGRGAGASVSKDGAPSWAPWRVLSHDLLHDMRTYTARTL
jgi:hypothetical protein